VCVWGPLRLRTPPYMGFSMRKTIRIMCWERSHYQRLALIVSVVVVVKVDLHPSDINTEFLYSRSTMNFWSAAASLYQSIGRFLHFSFSWGIYIINIYIFLYNKVWDPARFLRIQRDHVTGEIMIIIMISMIRMIIRLKKKLNRKKEQDP
jgi:hypothetical protein